MLALKRAFGYDSPIPSVAVIGAGIGGLGAALSLLQAGFDVHVHERAAAVSELGAGIQVSPNASRVLHRLGLAYYVQQRRLINFVALVDQDTWTRESWTDRGNIADALAAFDGWHLQLHEILRAVDETFIWALFDRAPRERDELMASGSTDFSLKAVEWIYDYDASRIDAPAPR